MRSVNLRTAEQTGEARDSGVIDYGPWNVVVFITKRRKTYFQYRSITEKEGPEPIALSEKFLNQADELIPLSELSPAQQQRALEIDLEVEQLTFQKEFERSKRQRAGDPDYEARKWRSASRHLAQTRQLLKNLPDQSVIKLREALQAKQKTLKEDEFLLSKENKPGIYYGLNSNCNWRIRDLYRLEFEVTQYGTSPERSKLGA